MQESPLKAGHTDKLCAPITIDEVPLLTPTHSNGQSIAVTRSNSVAVSDLHTHERTTHVPALIDRRFVGIWCDLRSFVCVCVHVFCMTTKSLLCMRAFSIGDDKRLVIILIYIIGPHSFQCVRCERSRAQYASRIFNIQLTNVE